MKKAENHPKGNSPLLFEAVCNLNFGFTVW